MSIDSKAKELEKVAVVAKERMDVLADELRALGCEVSFGVSVEVRQCEGGEENASR